MSEAMNKPPGRSTAITVGPTTYFKLTVQNIIIVGIFLVVNTATIVTMYLQVKWEINANKSDATASMEESRQNMVALLESNRSESKAADAALSSRIGTVETAESRNYAAIQLHERWLIALGIKNQVGPPGTPANGNP